MAKAQVTTGQSELAKWAAPALQAEITRLQTLLASCEGAETMPGFTVPSAPRKLRKPMSAAAKAAASKRMKAYWANRRKEKK